MTRSVAPSFVTRPGLFPFAHVLAVLGATSCLAPVVFAEDPPAAAADPAAAEPAKATGILPLPDYSGDIWTRSYLSGDLWGARSDLASKGFQCSIKSITTLQSVVDGGRDTDTAIGGGVDFRMNFDLDRMGLLPGAVIELLGQSRYGESVNAASGLLLPVNTYAFFPLTSPAEEDVPFVLEKLL